jgi:ribosome-associated protein
MTERLRLRADDPEINLTQVLKRAGWVGTGGEAKALIADGRVKVNGQVESRKRRKMTVGDRVELEDGPSLILVLAENPPLPSD